MNTSHYIFTCLLFCFSSCICKNNADFLHPNNYSKEKISITLQGVGFEFVPLASNGALFGKYEVTNEQYRLFRSKHNSVRRVFFGEVHASEMAKHGLDEDAHPVVRVRHSEAEDYCKWLTQKLQSENIIGAEEEVRLPRKSEWIDACKDGKNSDYAWGNEWPPPCGNLSKEIAPATDSYVMTCSVYDTCNNSAGIHGFAGNVAEWLARTTPSGESLAIGGSFISNSARRCRCDYVRSFLPHLMTDWVGFRLVIDRVK